jgi:hypothetical protein
MDKRASAAFSRILVTALPGRNESNGWNGAES